MLPHETSRGYMALHAASEAFRLVQTLRVGE
jgi:hypothetical protein